ncbi:MAG: peptidoglycan editing factor PgeF [Bacillota bacterium]
MRPKGGGLLGCTLTELGYVRIGFAGQGNLDHLVCAGFSTLKCDSSLEFIKLLGLDDGKFVRGVQVHGDTVTAVDMSHAGMTLPDTDGLVTSTRGLALTATFADCVPIFIVEPVAGIVGLVHAGWRGTAKRIGQRAVEAVEKLGGRPRRLLVTFGPHIRSCCYEVDEPVLREFLDSYRQAREFFTPSRPGHWMLDLERANRACLAEAGVSPSNVLSCGMCTYCNPLLFASRRRVGAATSLLRGAIFLK